MVSTFYFLPSTFYLPLVVIVGPTASGKSALAIELAKRFNGEIICADSRTVYRGLDIGTAKPTAVEQAKIPHHLLDVVEPEQDFTVADFKKLCNEAIDDILGRNKLPILVGGSGLYIDAVLYDYEFSEPAAARDPRNPRHLSPEEPRERSKIRSNTLIIGLEVDREALRARIKGRVEQMVAGGLVEETRQLEVAYPDSKALQAPAYKAFKKYLNGELTLGEAKNEFIRNDLNLAKRQMTWFRRNSSIQWVSNPSESIDIVTTFLNNKNK